MKSLRKFIPLLSPYKKSLVWGSVFLAIASATNLVVPLFIRRLVDVVMVQKDLEILNQMTLGIFGLFVLQMVFSSGHNYLFDLTEKRAIADFRKRIFNHLHTLSLSFFVKRRTGEILSRLTNDVTTVEGVITDLPATLLQQSIRLVGGLFIIIYFNWKLTFMVLVLLPVLIIFAKVFGRKLKHLSKEIQDKLAHSTTIAEENISCLPVIKS
ncbi:MAG: ABC transporter transmembrane domain-containing protein, partial [Nitrospinaceae bacterium]